MKDSFNIIRKDADAPCVSGSVLKKLGIAGADKDIVLSEKNSTVFNSLVLVSDQAYALMGPIGSLEWLSHPQDKLAGLKPSEACLAGLGTQVLDYLKELKAGT